jgi:signal transduction histidine kinase
LLQVINDILNVFKIEAGAMDVDLEAVSIEQCKESYLRMMQERAHAWDISLKTIISPLLTDTHADEVRVKQVLLNLISNAVKFTNLVGSIDISAGDLGDGFIEVVLCDTVAGTGITNELMEDMFKPFV